MELKNQCFIQIKFPLLIIVKLTLQSLSMFRLALAAGNETDRLALLALKDQLVGGGGGDSPGPLISWNSSLHFCEWQGVRCDEKNQRVMGLELSSMKLGGSISPSIGNLSFLRVANLSDNSLQGNIPKEFGRLSQLQFLNLSQNLLQGNIPLELSNCSNLRLIHLNQNNLTDEIPFSLGNNGLINLTRLSLSGNNLFGGIPSSLGNLSSLDYLQLSGNQLEGRIPDALGRLSNLKVFIISRNNLSGSIPSTFYNLSSLTYVNMARNKLSGGLAPEIGFAFPKLEILYLGANQFTGTIPRSITNITSLIQFDIFENSFSGSVPDKMGNLYNLDLLYMNYNQLGNGKPGDMGFLSSLTNCSLLKDLAIHRNRFGGVLPSSVGNLSTQLEYLYIGGNQISGIIPEGIGNLVNLTVLHIGENFFTEEVPSSIGKLQNLVQFDLSLNRLSGKIPSSIGNLSRLLYLYLNGNNFEGTIPLTLRNCKSMQVMDLSQNKLSGDLPNVIIGAFENLITVNLSHNSFTGIFPSDISNSDHLVELYVNNNSFSGEIPRKLGEISALRILQMQGNYFQGSIPVSFGSLRALENLDLSRNNLSGEIPVQLQELPFLVSLNLSFNQLEGEIPEEGVFKNTSGLSITGNKELCGGIPEIELPKCINQVESKKKGHALSTEVIVIMSLSISVALILVVLFVILCSRKRPVREMIPVVFQPAGYLKLSFKDLLQATNGFAPSNLIGVGSFGSVYKGVLHQQKNPIAVKVLNLQNLGAIKSFKVECEALRKVRHRNLVKVITSCSSINYQGNDFKALVLEFMPNGSLESWLHDDHDQYDGSRHLSFDQMLDIAIDVGNALDYLHHDCESTLIVHRDLKPSNVLLDDDMVAHVSDFGMAKLFSRDTGNLGIEQASSTTSIINGTIGYVPPEYGMGGPASPQGDIYSYGILLLEMITGRRPTDELFHDGLSLQNFCKMAIPDQLEEILDALLLEQIKIEKSQEIEYGDIWECLVSFTQVGVACSIEVPAERMKIKDTVAELHAIKARLHAWNQVDVLEF